MSPIDLQAALAAFSEHWQPRVVGRFDGGDEHCPVADEEAHVLLIEPKGTPNTGDPTTAEPRRLAPRRP